MPLTGSEPLYDRVTVEGKINQLLAPYSNLLYEFGDYGLQLLKRAFLMSEREIRDVVLIPVLLRHCIAMLDGTVILIEKGSTHAAHATLRSLQEGTLSIEWILRDNTETRALQFYISEKRRQLEWYRRYMPNRNEHKEFRAIIGSDYPDILADLNDSDKQRMARQEARRITNHLRSKRLRDINHWFQSHKDKAGREARWYQFRGPSSLADMAKRLGRKGEYTIVYGRGSEVTHGSRMHDHVHIPRRGRLHIEPVRSPEGIVFLMKMSSNFFLRVLYLMTEFYRPEELPNLSRKYKTDWRDRFMNFPDVTIDTEYLDM